MTASEKTLVVGPAWIGDMVMAQTLFKWLKQQQSDAIIDVLAPAWSLPLLARFPEVHQAIVMPVGHGRLALTTRYQLARELRTKKYTHSIVLPNSFKSALIPFWAKIPLRTGWRGEMRWGLLNDLRHLNKSDLPLMIQRFVALGLPQKTKLPALEPLWPHIEIDTNSVDTSLAKHGLVRGDRLVLALCPGAEYGPAKRWPADYFAEIARDKLSKNWDVWILGSAKESSIAREIQQITQQRCVDLTGKTALGEAIDLLSLASAVVSNDSGLMHIAAALARPLVVIYGSSDPRFTPPLTKRVKILSLHLPCTPCFQRECPLGHLQCLKDLSPPQVIRAIDELLDENISS